MDLLKAEVGACSPEARKRATAQYTAVSEKVASLREKPQSKAIKQAIQKLESGLEKLRPFIAVGAVPSGGSSSRVIASGLEGEQGMTVDVPQKTFAVTMGDGRVVHVVKNTSDKKGQPYTAKYLQQQSRIEAQNRVGFEADHGIQTIPGKGKAAPKPEGKKGASKYVNLAEREPGLHVRRKMTDRETGERVAIVDHVGKDGEILRSGNVVIRAERGDKTLTDRMTLQVAATKLKEAKNIEEEDLVSTKKLSAEDFSTPKKDVSKIASFDDLPHHEDAPIKPHAVSVSEYKKAVNDYYRNNRVEDSIKTTAKNTLDDISRKLRKKFKAPGADQDRILAELDTKKAVVGKKRDALLAEVKHRLSGDTIKKEHKDLVSEAVRRNKSGEYMYPEVAEEVSRDTLRTHGLPYTKMLPDPDNADSLIETIVRPQKGRLISSEKLREAGIAEETVKKFTASTPSADFDKHYASVVRQTPPPPTEIFEPTSRSELLDRETFSAKTPYKNTGTNKKTEIRKKHIEDGLSGDELKAAVAKDYDEWYNERFKTNRGETTAEDQSIRAIKEWSKGVKAKLVKRRYAALKDIGISPHHQPDRVSEEQREVIRRIGAAEARAREDLVKILSSSKSTTFGTLSDQGQQEVVGHIRKSVNNMLNLTDGIIMSGLFLNASLFKALSLSEDQKIRAFENSFGRDAGGVGPTTMNTGDIEAEEEEKDEKKSKAKMSKGVRLYVSC